MDESKVVRPTKAYKNADFLASRAARPLRIMSEHLETLERLSANGIEEFVLFFSSARGRSAAQLAEQRAKAQAQISAAGATEAQKEKANASLANLARIEWMCPMYDQVRLRARAPSLPLALSLFARVWNL